MLEFYFRLLSFLTTSYRQLKTVFYLVPLSLNSYPIASISSLVNCLPPSRLEW